MSSNTPNTFKKILEPIENYLIKVEDLVLKNLETEIPLLTEVGQYLLNSGGKRFRPALLLFAAGSVGKLSDKTCLAANIIEYIHTATLLHDDVVDNADIRRSKKSARSIWGNEASVLVGDYLFTVSFKHLASLKNMKMVETLSKATTMMAKGEILQLTRSYENTTENEYLEIIINKTACLMGAAMAIGGILGGADEQQQEALYQCGNNIGISFQLIDDALDYQLENSSLGKQQGVDLKERKITLPLSHLLSNASEKDKNEVLAILDLDEINDQHVKTVSQLIDSYRSNEYTVQRANHYCIQAKKALSIIPDNAYKLGIIQLADFVVNRNS
ncbi:MAG: polyprenyl synthetase family protein [Deltaproteobacteria bacterium]|nr:polyprenyl synthetase family protein [Deltaproteobacteria bacterium]